jgi:hypothetical protein
MFQRNMLSPSSGAEGREPVRGRKYGIWLRTNRELQAGYREGAGYGVKKRSPCQGLVEGVVFLIWTGLYSLKWRMRGVRDLLREKPSSQLMLLGWNPISITSLVMWSMYLDLLASMMVQVYAVFSFSLKI